MVMVVVKYLYVQTILIGGCLHSMDSGMEWNSGMEYWNSGMLSCEWPIPSNGRMR